MGSKKQRNKKINNLKKINTLKKPQICWIDEVGSTMNMEDYFKFANQLDWVKFDHIATDKHPSSDWYKK